MIELKHRWHLHVNHSDQIQKLDKYGASLLILIVLIVMTKSPGKLMPKRQPLLLDQLLESPYRSVPSIQ